VQVPLEDILSLASSLACHLLDHTPMSDPASPPRKSRSRRAGAAGAADEAEGDAAAGAGKGLSMVTAWCGTLLKLVASWLVKT
jgi:hypothetical protein